MLTSVSKQTLASLLPQSHLWQDPPGCFTSTLTLNSPAQGLDCSFPGGSSLCNPVILATMAPLPFTSWLVPCPGHVHSGLPQRSVSTCILPYIYNKNLNPLKSSQVLLFLLFIQQQPCLSLSSAGIKDTHHRAGSGIKCFTMRK